MKYPKTKKEFMGFYGEFKYCDSPKHDGTIRIEPGWAGRNIRRINIPLRKWVSLRGDLEYWTIDIHRKLVDDVTEVFEEFDKLNTGYQIRELGGWVTRRQYWRSHGPLSIHAWGAAIDINWTSNPAGESPGDMPQQLVELFEGHGWTWGGRWEHKDQMHFQAGKW